MSRIGYLPITIPPGVDVTTEKDKVTVRGSKGELVVAISQGISVSQKDGELVLSREDDTRFTASSHGLMRTLLFNAIQGVSEGFSKQLEINGVGFKVQVSGNKVVLNLGYSHPNEVSLPEGVTAHVEGNVLTISGYDKQQVGQVAADIRALRKPEPYKGKGIKYVGERIIRKAGKAAGAGK